MHRARWIASAVISLATLGVGTGIAVGSGAIEVGDDKPLSGSTLEKASTAALEHTGGGTVTDTEIDDGGTAYEVEVRLDDGRQVEVNLDTRFVVTGQELDDDSTDGADDDGADDDGAGDDGAGDDGASGGPSAVRPTP